jgi:hypothetical protein
MPLAFATLYMMKLYILRNNLVLSFISHEQPVDSEIVPILRKQTPRITDRLHCITSSYKGPFGEKRRSIFGLVIDTDHLKQTKTGG